MLARLLLASCVFVLSVETVVPHDGPIVHAQQGPLQGVYQTSRYGRKFMAFQGIPYAQPPLGELRFKDPVPVKPWTGTWNATEAGSACIQIRRVPPPKYGIWEKFVGEEDCLFLNIYTPKLPKDGANPNLDVFFNLHSGAFMYGWGHEFGPEILMDRDVIWVTINYRLSALGFLDTEDDVVPGNMGMKDQAVALRWIKDNIAAFGGNPDSITLTGTSAGGASVHFHYLSPWSRGLFKGGISQSGTVTVPWVIMEEGRAKANKLGALLGCPTDNTKALVDCLRTRPAEQIIKNVWHLQELNRRFDELIVHILDFNHTAPHHLKQEIVNRIRKHYFNNQPISMKTFKQLTQLLTDRTYLLDGARASKLQAAVTKSPVYFYLFGYRGKHSFTERMTGKNIDLGASHLDDTAYTIEYGFKSDETEDDREMSKILLDIWTNFARNGNPAPPGGKLKWNPTAHNSKDLSYLFIGGPDKLEMRTSDKLGDPAFWDSLPIQEKQLRVDTPLTESHSEL
ncbi:hypothetical protein C0J52_16277 [Blattella germanica]|nr:hypothetical protein C0J52_16277 [Blattella germanica]